MFSGDCNIGERNEEEGNSNASIFATGSRGLESRWYNGGLKVLGGSQCTETPLGLEST